MEEPQDLEALGRERDERIALLEGRLRRRSPVGVRAPVAVLCIFGALVLAWMNRLDFAYFFSPREPVTLGSEGAYLFDEVVPNRYVQLHGTPSSQGIYIEEHGEQFVLVGLRDTPFVVRRHLLAGEGVKDGKGAPPNASPFGVRGRLLTEAQAPRYDRAFAELKQWPVIRPRNGELYVILEGGSPGSDTGIPLMLGFLVVFVLLNAYFVVRAVQHRLRGA